MVRLMPRSAQAVHRDVASSWASAAAGLKRWGIYGDPSPKMSFPWVFFHDEEVKGTILSMPHIHPLTNKAL